MASERGYRDKWLRYHRRYENKATTVFLKVFRSWGRSIDFDKLNVLNYSKVVSEAINTEQLKNAYIDVYYTIGRLHGKRVGYAFNKEVKREKFFILGDFETSLQNYIRNYVNEWAFEYFKTVEQSYKDTIVKVIAEMVANGEGSEDIARRIEKLVNNRNFYRWQARRIARTEATAAANIGALRAGKISGFKTNKVWISSNDSRTRRIPENEFDHFNMNGVQVGIDEFFKVPAKNMQGFELMRHPGDRGGIGNATTSPGNTINCRCSVGIVPARDEEGNLIREL